MTIRSRFLAVSAIALLGAAAQAEPYHGVHAPTRVQSRGAVRAEAVRTAAAPDQNVVRGSRGPEIAASTQSREQVRAQAVHTAAAPDQNVTPGSRVNSSVVSTRRYPVDARGLAQAGSPGAVQ